MQTRRGTRILVVDHEQDARAGLQELLECAGHAVLVAESGVDALLMAARSAPDLVITDVDIQCSSGLSLLQKLRALDKDLPVIVTTTVSNRRHAVMALRSGAEEFLLEPFDFDALAVVVERALERRALKADVADLRRQLSERDSGGLQGLIGGALRSPAATIAELQRRAIIEALEATDGSTARTAELLGISVRTVQYRLHQYGIARPAVRACAPPASAALVQ